MHSFLGLLAAQLGTMQDSASLRDALEASIFFASSMGRLGADFTAQLPALFEPKLHGLVVSFWKDGTLQLSETLKVCREAGVASPLVSHSAPTEAALASSTPLDEPQAPPRQLMALPPLARLVNAVLTGLNELRRCLLPGIFCSLRSSLEKVIGSVEKELQANERAVLAPGLRGEAKDLRELAARFKTVFSEIVEPYLRGSLEAALGNKEQAEHFHKILRENEKEPEEEVEEEEQPEELAQEEEDENPAPEEAEQTEADTAEVDNDDLQQDVNE